MDNLFFHWYENPDEGLVFLKPNFSQNLSNSIIQKYGTVKDAVDQLKINRKTVYQLKKNKPIRVKTLKRISNKLNLNFNGLNKYILGIGASKHFLNVKFPIKLDSIHSSILIAAFMSDGHNESEHPHYANVGFLGNKIINSAQSIIKDVPYEFRNEHVRFHPILGRILLKIGVPYGCKSYINPDVPEVIFSNQEWMREYLIQIFDDEGHAATRISRKIVLGRSVTLRNFPDDFSKNMEFSKKIYFNQLPEDIKEIALRTPPKLLTSEQKMLNEFGIKLSLRCRGFVSIKQGFLLIGL